MLPYPANHTLTLYLRPGRHWLILGPGWAVLAAALAAGAWQLAPGDWVSLALLWLLADPVLGSIWQLLVRERVWADLTSESPQVTAVLRPRIPYVRRRSAAYRLLVWWHNFQTHPAGAGYSLAFLTLGGLTLAAFLGPLIVGYTGLSILLAFALGRGAKQDQGLGRIVWQGLATFLVPYLAGLMVGGRLALSPILLGFVFWIVQLGGICLIGQSGRLGWLVVAGQATAALLLLALVKPLAGVVVALGALFSRLILSHLHLADDGPLSVSPWLWLLPLVSLLVAAGAMGGWG